MIKTNTLYRTFFYLILVGLGISCQTNNLDPTGNDADYFPLATGDYWIYQVTQENYGITAGKTVYQVQQKIGNSYTQNGQLFYLIEESIKRSEQAGWQLNTIRTVYKNLKEVVSSENNVPVVRMSFPITTTTSWNVNTYNANADTLLRYENTGKAFAVNKLNFDRTVSVLGNNDSTLVSQDKYLRVYAQNVGLVYGESTSLDYCQSTPDCIGKAIIESGTRQKWELLSSNRLP